MRLDRLEGNPDSRVAWGSDIAAQMLRRFGIRYVSLNPGASYRGFHDSIVNHLGNENPGIILCLHEDHSVAIAHGYAKATGEPMACVLHSNVGLLHGMMSLFNAWCDRAPMFVLGATGPVAAEKRRPWIDWIHTSRDQGAYIRSIIKWDDQPTSPDALVESMMRANMLTRSAPTAPVYICLDAGFQEQKLDKRAGMAGRDALPAAAAAAAVAAIRRCRRVALLAERAAAGDHVRPRLAQVRILDAAHQACREARRLRRSPISSRAPRSRPIIRRITVRRSTCSARTRASFFCEADVILALDWVDLGGALRQAKNVGTVRREDHRLLARPEPAHRRQHGISGAAAGRCGDGRRPPMWSSPSCRCARRAAARIRGRSRCRPSQGRQRRRHQHGAGRDAPCAISSTIRRT